MSQCIFCKIAAEQEEASILYQDESYLVLMDAYPLTNGHCLVIPKKHYVRLDELKAKERAKLFSLGNKVIAAQKKAGLGIHGTNLLINDGKAANQTVPHLHLHLIPRASGDLIKSLPKIILHISGLFDFKSSRKKLNQQADEISAYL